VVVLDADKRKARRWIRVDWNLKYFSKMGKMFGYQGNEEKMRINMVNQISE
jgi:hypothetical protein